MTATDDAKRVADRLLEAFLEHHDADAAADVYAEDALIWDPGEPDVIKGRDAIRENLARYLKAFPDLSGEIMNQFGSGDWFATEVTLRGTNDGPLEVEPGVTMPPTGRAFEVKVCWVIRATSDGFVAEDHTYYDNATFMEQLGLAGEPN